ncbi:C2H2-type zinc finger transcription factor [Phycomyces blakesleeanus NRRL 1555(-)]|uniref:C2H2-type zinc finger transcription factor n=1 Tax=Phycomyces blakesleeanus (strain ATCC 8743b / DSM 1359 / FGSC 10004 / NBRC 33097 / NRRL 1555) TaxID=763407 RepID=A0A162UI43_PHYB8|nr:C2H2-type zinc finger transcription factor [Phycomyces blakesleeanus NRRL 1555(-)]OAD75383.1 C2H2-type zinc finger transcription factor [Phycomyces blakesleeanus NRRL 1555(-)]|eukprot:XP_018293423.1 C2H2-type zinc finger transcription factor [Phycomyces blakesleeanus NRRL 1555(-)]
MSYSNKRTRSFTDLPSFECDFCSLTHHTSKQLRNHKRIYKTVNVHVGNENLQEPAMKSAPAQTNIEDVPFDPFQSRTFKASCNFKAGDQGHVYNDNIFTNNTFTTSELFSIGLNDLVTDHGVSTDLHSLLVDLMNMVIRDNDKLKEEYNPKVLHAGPVNTLIKSKTDLKSYEYDICENVCLLFDITKDEDKCSICKAYRYKEIDGDSSLVPVNIMKMMSIGDQLARLLGNDKTRAKLQCRANRQSISNKISDYFDGEEYKTLKEQQLFDSPNDIAIALFLDGFVNQEKSKQQLTIVHDFLYMGYLRLIFFFVSRCTDEYLIQLAIIPGKPKDLDSFLLPIIDEISSLGKHGLIIKKFNGEQIKAKVHMVMASGDIPQVTQFCHHTGHMSNKGCRICEVEGVSPPHGKGKYYQDRCATLRTKDDFVGGYRKTHLFIGSVIFYFSHNISPYDENCRQLLVLVSVMNDHSAADYNNSIPVVTLEATSIYQRLAVISINDIQNQVGLVQTAMDSKKYKVVAPYYIFNEDMKSTAGKLSHIKL